MWATLDRVILGKDPQITRADIDHIPDPQVHFVELPASDLRLNQRSLLILFRFGLYIRPDPVVDFRLLRCFVVAALQLQLYVRAYAINVAEDGADGSVVVRLAADVNVIRPGVTHRRTVSSACGTLLNFDVPISDARPPVVDS